MCTRLDPTYTHMKQTFKFCIFKERKYNYDPDNKLCFYLPFKYMYEHEIYRISRLAL